MTRRRLLSTSPAAPQPVPPPPADAATTSVVQLPLNETCGRQVPPPEKPPLSPKGTRGPRSLYTPILAAIARALIVIAPVALAFTVRATAERLDHWSDAVATGAFILAMVSSGAASVWTQVRWYRRSLVAAVIMLFWVALLIEGIMVAVLNRSVPAWVTSSVTIVAVLALCVAVYVTYLRQRNFFKRHEQGDRISLAIFWVTSTVFFCREPAASAGGATLFAADFLVGVLMAGTTLLMAALPLVFRDWIEGRTADLRATGITSKTAFRLLLRFEDCYGKPSTVVACLLAYYGLSFTLNNRDKVGVTSLIVVAVFVLPFMPFLGSDRRPPG